MPIRCLGVLPLLALAVFAGCAALQATPARRCGSEQLGHAVAGFMRPITLDQVGETIGEMAGRPAAEMYAEPVSGPSLRTQVDGLGRAVEDGAQLWVFVGPWPSWEGVAAVRECDVVATARVWHR